MNRRNFIVKSGMLNGGALLLSDPLMAFFSRFLEENTEQFVRQFSHTCDLLRTEDLLHLRFYFVNLHKEYGYLKKRVTDMEANSNNINAYMLVRIPQQHIAENTIGTSELERLETTNAFIAGYSFLCFKLKEGIDTIVYTEEGLLNWNNFDLITLDELDNLNELKDTAPSFTHYPNNLIESEDNRNLKFFFDVGGIKLPVSIIEIYKLFLSPIAPALKGKRGRLDYGYIFTNPKNEIANYLKVGSDFNITRPWENNLVYAIQYPTHRVELSPYLKAVAYQLDQNEGDLVPSGYDRMQITEHTLLDFDTNERDVISQYFKIGTLGLTSKLEYDNLYAKKGSSFVGWKHDVKNGRDNYVEVVYIGIDIRTNKKVLVARIGERMHHKGKSLFVERNFMSYIDLTQTYGNKDFPYSKSEILRNGFYFKPVHFKTSKTVVDKLEYGDDGPQPFIPVTEDSKTGDEMSSNRVKIIYNQSVKFDKQEETKEIESHIAVIFKSQFEKTEEFNKINVAHQKLTQTEDYKKLLQERVGGSKLAYVTAFSKGQGENNKNTSLATENFQFLTKKISENFYDPHPLSHHLVYAQVKAPQMEGLTNKGYHHFSYTDSFVKTEELKRQSLNLESKINTFDSSNKETFFEYDFKDAGSINVKSNAELDKAKGRLEELKSELELNNNLQEVNKVFFKSVKNSVEDSFKAEGEAIKKALSNNNAMSLINPDPVIEGLSLMDQGVTLAENTIIDIKKNLLKPEDILRGMNAEIFKGIKIVDILRNVIPIDQSPVFEVIEEAKEGIMVIQSYRTTYSKLKQDIIDLPKDIKRLSNELLNNEVKKAEKYINKRLELEREILRKKVEDAIITPFEEKVFEIVSNGPSLLESDRLVNDLLEIKVDSSIEFVKERVESFIAKAQEDERYLIAGVYGLRRKSVKSLTRVIKYLNTVASDKHTQLTLIIQEQLSNYRKEVKEILKQLSDLTEPPQILKDVNRSLKAVDLDSSIKKLCLKTEDEIRKEVLHKITIIVGDPIYLFDRIKGRVSHLLAQAENRSIVPKLEQLSNQVDFILYYYYENKLMFENQLAVLEEQLFDEADNILTRLTEAHEVQRAILLLKELEKRYQDYVLNGKAEEEINQAFEFLLKQINQSDEFSALKQKLDELEIVVDNVKSVVSQFERQKDELEGKAKELIDHFNAERNKIKEEIDGYRKDLKQAEYKLNNFVKVTLEEEKNKLKQANEKLAKAIQENATVSKIEELRKEVGGYEKHIRKILDNNKKKVNYNWKMEPESFSDFKSNYVSFFKSPYTNMEVDVRSEINYELSLDSPPKYIGTDYLSSNSLENFTLNFFDVLSIEFGEIKFVTGTKVDTDFEVNIKNIQFSGALSFLKAFESLLDVLNFIQNLVQGGIQIDHNFRLPEIKGGAFNFLNGKFYAGVYLPIGNDRPMRLDVGVNSPGDMFLVNYGYFGGRGCFQMGLTPKDGIVKVVLIIEFGGIIMINAGVAKGYVYLFAGIYYRKLNHTVEIRGYLVAGGCLDIAGLVSASITFVMGLKGNGNYLKGYCSVNYNVKIGPFFEKTFRLPYERKIKGTEPSSSGGSSLMESGTENLAIEKEMDKELWETYLTSFKVI